jgi:alpha-amylase/alpha-mannosidase (GH57 family)
VHLPVLERYPGGDARVQWHIDQGVATFERYFGGPPQGCWPSEGSISGDALRVFEQAGFRWVASGENVLRNSVHNYGAQSEPTAHRVYTTENSSLACFFRDDGLSDAIGFTYATWHGDDAVSNFVHNLENIADECKDDLPNSVVAVILDGENAWEHYPENGYHFLSALYTRLAEHPRLQLATFSDCLDKGISLRTLPGVTAGSWVYGTFSTWIGDADKNRAWDMLGDVKHHFDRAQQAGRLSTEQFTAAEKQLAICEGSDWFWWFGDYNPANIVSDFERLYRMQLVNLYQILGVEPPEYLSHVFAHGSGAPESGGVMRRGS